MVLCYLMRNKAIGVDKPAQILVQPTNNRSTKKTNVFIFQHFCHISRRKYVCHHFITIRILSRVQQLSIVTLFQLLHKALSPLYQISLLVTTFAAQYRGQTSSDQFNGECADNGEITINNQAFPQQVSSSHFVLTTRYLI